jgi:hypothetical protein
MANQDDAHGHNPNSHLLEQRPAAWADGKERLLQTHTA